MLCYWNSVVTVHMAQLDIFWDVLKIKFVDKGYVIIVTYLVTIYSLAQKFLNANGQTVFKTTQLINTKFWGV